MSEYISFLSPREFCLRFGGKICKFGLRSRFDRFDHYKNDLTEIPHKRYIVATVTKLTVRIDNLKIQIDTQSYLSRLFLCLRYMMLCYGQRYRRVVKPTAFSVWSGIVNPVPVYLYSIDNEKDRFEPSKTGDFAHA